MNTSFSTLQTSYGKCYFWKIYSLVTRHHHVLQTEYFRKETYSPVVSLRKFSKLSSGTCCKKLSALIWYHEEIILWIICEILFSASGFKVEDFYSTVIANCVFNGFLSYTSITLNIVTIYAIRKNSSLPKTLRTLLLSLAVSEVFVGLIIQPFYISVLLQGLHQNIAACSTNEAFEMMVVLFSTASFWGVVTISVDRFLALHFHLRYQELVTHKRVVAVIISIWLYSAFLSSMALWVPPNIQSHFISIGTVIGLLFTTLAYIRIYLAVRRHKNQIRVRQEQNAANFASLIKSAVGKFYVFLVFLACYLPIFICLTAIAIYGPNVALNRLFLFSCTLVFLNSTLNPVIYCWKMRQIRHTVMNILRSMSWFRINEAP